MWWGIRVLWCSPRRLALSGHILWWQKARPWRGQQLRRGGGRGRHKMEATLRGRAGTCLDFGGSSLSMRASPALRGRSCLAPHAKQLHHHLPSPSPLHAGCSPIVPPRHFAAPTLGLAMASRQTLGGKVDFSPQKSHLEHSCMVVAPRQPLSIVVLLLPGTT